MATAADSSASYSSSHSPSPSFASNPRNLSSPWSHVVRGESEENPAPAAPSSPSKASDRSLLMTAGSDTAVDVSAGEGSGAPAPPPSANVVNQEAAASAQEINSAWKTVSSVSINAGPVMGAESWPALSEAIKIPHKSASSDSLKGLANGSGPVSAAPVTTSPKPSAANLNPISSGNHSLPLRQKGTKRHSGGSSSAIPTNNNSGNGTGIISTSSRPAPAESTQNASDKTPASGSSHNDMDHGSRVGGSEQPRHNSSNRRGNNGGSGAHHHTNFGNRGSHEWNTRSFNGGRDIHPQQQHQPHPRALSRPFIRPQAPGPAPFIPPPPQIRPFANPMGYHDISPPIFYVPPPLPFVPPAQMYFAPLDLQLRTMLLQQIEYYFSPENLCRDVFLRQNMDEEGWVPVSLVSGFRRVINLTSHIPLILDSVRGSAIVEVQGDKIRRRNDWRNWPSLATSAGPRQLVGRSNIDSLANQLTHIGLEESNSGEHTWGAPNGRSVSGELAGQHPLGGDNSERSPRTQEVSPFADHRDVI